MTSFANDTALTMLDRSMNVPADARAMLLIVHGLAEHRGRYVKVVEFFNARGIACCTFDLRGHGKSPGRRGDVGSFDDFVNDAAMLIDSLKFTYPQLPLFMWGHSMGAVIATLAAAERSPKLRGVITSSPPFAAFDKIPWIAAWMMKWLSRIAPTRMVPLPVKPERLSRDASVGEAYIADPLVPKTVTVRLLVGLSDASARALRATRRVRVPWLALHGGEDRVAPPIGSQRLIDALQSADKQIMLWPAARHEVHNELEPERTEFLEKIAGWIEERTGDVRS